MRPETIPKIVKGSISIWVVKSSMQSSFKAINELIYSFTSRYSIKPSLRKSLKSFSPAFKLSISVYLIFVFPFSTIIRGLTNLPPSDDIYIPFY